MSGGFVAIGVGLLAVLLVGYFGQRHLPPPKPTFIGLDLGTTFSCVGAYHPVSGNVTIFLTDQGSQCIPSVIAILPDNGTVLVGKAALNQAPAIPSANLIYDAKRFIGRSFQQTSDEDFQLIKDRYPFTIRLTPDRSRAFFEVVLSNGTSIFFSPEDVGAYILHYLRTTATNCLGRPVSRAVLSVPAEFDQVQRNATKKAAAKAGLDVWRVIQEPTAAAMAYGLHEEEGIQMVLVVDLGGGTLDVSLLNRQGGIFLTAAIAGNSYLGGQDFTHRLLNHILEKSNLTIEGNGNTTETEISDQVVLTSETSSEANTVPSPHLRSIDQATLQKLRLLADQVKIDLTDQEFIHIKMEMPVELDLNITKQTFNQINEDLFQKVLRPIEVVLEEVSLEREDVDEIVLVGGSTRVPRVREVIGEYFDRDLSNPPKVDPELAVATGVSVQAGILGGMWPLQVSAVEIPMKVRKIHVL
ncbi:heat shock 70 kDa protein 13-like [Convolutriloba macropyga]|uniref:heat shock 70 kDa protein 13-like n=1 Tax=Convolutriloba macropyga TaxID=536237 RepID=UPI003F5248DF